MSSSTSRSGDCHVDDDHVRRELGDPRAQVVAAREPRDDGVALGRERPLEIARALRLLVHQHDPRPQDHPPPEAAGKCESRAVADVRPRAASGRSGRAPDFGVPAGRAGGRPDGTRYRGEMVGERNLLLQGGLTRRRFVVSSIAAGFAAATLPIRADGVITTPDDGLVAGEVKIPAARRRDAGLPRDARRRAGRSRSVLVVQEIFGVHEHIKDVCRRFAKARLPRGRAGALRAPGRRSKITDIKEHLDADRLARCPTRR